MVMLVGPYTCWKRGRAIQLFQTNACADFFGLLSISNKSLDTYMTIIIALVSDNSYSSVLNLVVTFKSYSVWQASRLDLDYLGLPFQ